MKITPIQKKSFHDILVSVGIDWKQFKENIIARTDFHTEYPRLVHKATELFFGFRNNEISGNWYVEFSPGENNRTLSSYPITRDWDGVIQLFKVWAELMKREIDAYDFLNQLKKFNENQIRSQGLYDINEDKFAKEEEDFIRSQLSEFGQRIIKIDLVQNQLSEIQKRIEYLNSRLDKKYPKIDWLNIFVGTIMSTLTAEGMESLKDPSVMDNLKLLFHTVTSWRFLK